VDVDINVALIEYVRRTHFPAWLVLDTLQRQGFSENDVLTALLLQVQDHVICVTNRGRLVVPFTSLAHPLDMC